MQYYTADIHAFHTNILRYSKRPYPTLEAMHAAFLATLKATLQRHDHLWIIGDFSFHANKQDGLEAFFHAIPGQKHLVKGNHDSTRVNRLPWASVHDMTTVMDGDQKFVLFHYPMMTWPGIRHGALQLFGHVHQNWAGTNRSINVGVDLWNYKPVTKADILARRPTLPDMPFLEEMEPGISPYKS